MTLDNCRPDTIYRIYAYNVHSSVSDLMCGNPGGVDLNNLCPDVCVKDSETDPF